MGLLARMEVLRSCDADVSEAVDKKFVADYFFLLRKSGFGTGLRERRFIRAQFA
jgi:hypothetical protein